MYKFHQVVKSNALGQSFCSLHAAERKIQARYSAAALMREQARWTSHTTAHIEHMVLTADIRRVSECIQSIGAAVVVLIEVFEIRLR